MRLHASRSRLDVLLWASVVSLSCGPSKSPGPTTVGPSGAAAASAVPGGGGSGGSRAAGASSTGGMTGTGMALGSGGVMGQSGGSGAMALGSGGASSTPGQGGAAGAVSSTCMPVTPTACAAPQVQITEVDLGANVVVNEDDAALKMLSISPVPSGGSRLAFMSNDGNVHVATLGCQDQFVSAFSLPGMDYGDIYADDKGGVLLLTRDAMGGGTLNCGMPSNLCGTPPNPPVPCYDMYMVRFDGTSETWATKLTTSSATLPPYSTGPMGAQTYFIWWYAHHGRLAFDGTNWAAYYGAATSVSQMCTSGGNTAINIHQGDEMRVVDPSGKMLTGHGSFTWGCSHSGFEKIVWDPGTSAFAMICRSDGFPNAGLNVNASKLVSAISPSMSSVSNLVLGAMAGRYWTLVSNMGTLHLMQFTTAGGTVTDTSLGNGDKPHLVKYGNHLFGAWASGSSMVGQVFDASSGAAIGATVPIAVPGHQFQDFREYSDGSVAYAAPGSAPTKVKIVRVLPCKD